MNETFNVIFGILITGNEYVALFRQKLKDQLAYARSVPTNPSDLFILYDNEENDIKDTWLQPYGKYLNMGSARPLEYLIKNVSEYIHYIESDDRAATEFILGKIFKTDYTRLTTARLDRECKSYSPSEELVELMARCRSSSGSWKGEAPKLSVYLITS